MVYPIRNSDGEIIGHARHSSTSTDQEQIDEKSPEWLAYIAPKVADIKTEARRRIEAVMPSWVVERATTGGPRIPANVLTYVKDVREASDTLEGTLPSNYADDSHWPTAPASIVYEDAPVLTRKDDVWDRCTDAEAELLMTALDQAPAKLRGMWMDNPYISHSHDQFSTLRSAIVTVLGGNTAAEDRADELLAESEVL